MRIDNIIEWIIEHSDECCRITSVGMDSTIDSDIESVCSTEADGPQSSSVAVVAAAITAAPSPIPSISKYLTAKDFVDADKYAMYVRSHVKKGMTVRCCKEFEEIASDDIGTVLQVDTEGLHDLNVQVDWRNHGANYWMRFIHIELLDQERLQSKYEMPSMSVGSHVRINRACTEATGAGDWQSGDVIGVVTSIRNDAEVTVDVGGGQLIWTGKIYELEVVDATAVTTSLCDDMAAGDDHEMGDIVDDWSQCIQSLTVSSNETNARHLLDRSANYWLSCSTHNIGPGKHWIRLQMHDNMLVHTLAVVVSGNDGSHMPSLIIIRVGDAVDKLKDYSWVSVKQSDTNLLLLSEIKEHYPWIEIVIKQCHNNGIQCKIHRIDIVGRLKQTDLDKMLMNASFMVKENELFNEAMVTGPPCYDDHATKGETPCKVYVWGLNDKEQLAGVKGSKVKCPVFSGVLSQLRPIHIAGGSKSLFIVSNDGKVYACGEGTNGRLGLGNNCNVSVPRQLPVVNQFIVKKVAVHSGGKHAMALTLDGRVFSWGEGMGRAICRNSSCI